MRGRRPGARPPEAARDEDAGGCPFCEGHEDETPPESFALGPPGREPNAPGWRLRVVPNRYPAFAGALGRQEVVVHSPRHVTSLADLSDGELDAVAEAWQARGSDARVDGFPYVQALVNEGRAAGSSLPHTHSQLVWLAETPPGLERERGSAEGGGCRLCDLIATEREAGVRVLDETDGLVALCPLASWAPYELLVAPIACEPDAFRSELLAAALHLCADGVRRLHALEGRAPLNAWLHTSPFAGRPLHWHLELVPRLTVLAGLELGAELYVNPVPPEDAAAALRAAS